MARSINDIKKQITDVWMQSPNIRAAYGLDETKSFEDQFSTASIESIWFYAVAFGIWFLETLHDTFTADVTTYVSNMKPHTIRWYVNKALGFQFGFELLPDSDLFDNAGAADDQIAASKVVAFADAVEVPDANGRISLRIKVAAQNGTDLQPITPAQLTALQEYFARIKDAGVPLTVTSTAPDRLVENWTIYYDPLVLDANGNRLDGTAQDVVRTAIKAYLQALPFDSIYALQLHTEAVKATQGVVLCQINNAQSSYGSLPLAQINTLMIPDAGYLRFINENDLIVTMVAHNPIGN
jgi:hypothetical protein